MHECENCGQACDCDGEDTWLETPDDCSHDCEDFDDEDDLNDFADDDRPALPITIALNHIALGVERGSICSACAKDEHWDCNLATWCTCDDPTDGDEEAQYYESDPYP